VNPLVKVLVCGVGVSVFISVCDEFCMYNLSLIYPLRQRDIIHGKAHLVCRYSRVILVRRLRMKNRSFTDGDISVNMNENFARVYAFRGMGVGATREGSSDDIGIYISICAHKISHRDFTHI
jgi:hypothetical protein